MILKLILSITLALLACQTTHAQGTFQGSAAGQMFGGGGVPSSPDAQFRFDQADEMQTVDWGDALFTVDQVVDESSARLSVRCGQRSKGGVALLGRTVELWYEGPTEGLVDGKKFYDLVVVRKAGAKSYSSNGGIRTIPKVKHFTKEEIPKLVQKWKDLNPNHVTLSGKAISAAPVVIKEYKNGTVSVTNYDGNAKLKLSKLDKKSKGIVKDWRAAQRAKK